MSDIEYKDMNQSTIDVLNIIKERAKYKRMNEAVREELVSMIEEISSEMSAILEGAILNEEFHSEVSECEEVKPLTDWRKIRTNGNGYKEERYDENFKPKRDPNLYAMDRFA